MALFDKDLSRLTEGDLLALIEDKESEHKRIEYKRDRIGQGDTEKKEFMYDASSLANTLGGDLVIGMDAKKSVPTNLVGLGDIDADSEILRLEHTLRDGIRPPITGIRSIPVPLANGSFAIVMRIPKSWNPPHQVTYQNAFRFYARGSNGKYQIDVNELRSIFSISSTVADRLRNFRIERTAKIASGDTPVTLLSGGVLVIHVAPFSAFGVGATFPLQEAAQSAAGFPTMGDGYTRRPQVTFDGLLVTSNSEAPPKPQRAYTQVLRSGVVEAVASSLARGQGHEWLILPYLTA
jgi:hypothetical protein